ncbi:HD domain-containing phosphohydrolase, partial [Eisenbergiella sp.]
HQLTVSCGIVLYPENIGAKEDLLGSCARAVYYAKTRGKNQTALWRKEDRPREGSGYYRSSFEKIAPTIYALMAAVDAKDQITFRHSLKVSEYATVLAQALELKEEEVEIIREAGLLHDIGKIGIPENILKKQTFLTEEEYAVMKEHVKNAVEMIRFLPDMNYMLPAVIAHHERYDGKGYPTGIAGDAIPLGGRCLALADSFDTMTARRPYKEPMQISYAVKELEKGKNTQFDPYLTDVFLQLIEEGKIRVWCRQDG